MLEEVDSINWAKLEHSHGTAEDVPAHLQAIAGTSEEARDAAFSYIWGYLLHQGTRHNSCPYIVRFLFELLEAPGCPVQQRLIDLLLALAVGYGEFFLPYGYDLAKEEQRRQEDDWCGLLVYEEARATYYEVHARADRFKRFMGPENNPEVRLSATFAVAHFAQSLAAAHTEVAAYIRDETDPGQIQSLILCFGMLGRFADPRPDLGILTPYLDAAQPQELRVAASIALTTVLGPDTPEPAVEILLTALSESWELESFRIDWQWWNAGDLLGYAALALRLLGPGRRNEIADALCSALTSTPFRTFAMPDTLVDVLFPESKPRPVCQVSDFDAVQYRSMGTLVRTKHWRTWMADRFLPAGITGTDYVMAVSRFIREVAGKCITRSSHLKRAGKALGPGQKKHRS